MVLPFLCFLVFVDAGLRSKLNKILASQYLTAAPVMNYGTYQVPVQESIPPVNVQVQAEDAEVQYQQKVKIINANNISLQIPLELSLLSVIYMPCLLIKFVQL